MKYLVTLICCVLFTLLSACQSDVHVEHVEKWPEATLHQVSTLDALLHGEYDGVMTIGELTSMGQVGIGTLDKLDGELIIMGGAYQVKADGSVREVGSEETTPFAVVAPNPRDLWSPARGVDFIHDRLNRIMNLQQLNTALETEIDSKNYFTLVTIHARMREITLRSVPAQKKPYPPLTEVIAQQSVWEHKDVKGTLVGLYAPAWVKGINVPGWHWHFISDDRKIGGHVLKVKLGEALDQLEVYDRDGNGIELVSARFYSRDNPYRPGEEISDPKYKYYTILHRQTIRHFNLILPDTESFKKMDLTKDTTKDIHRVETHEH